MRLTTSFRSFFSARAARRASRAEDKFVMPSNFKRLFHSTIGDGIGDDLVQNILPIVAVGLLGASAFQTSVLNALGLAAFLLLGVPIGVLVDRWSKRNTLVLANVVRAVAAVSVPVAAWGNVLSIWHLFIVAAIISTADVFFTTAQSAFMPTFLSGKDLGFGYARIQGMQSGLAIVTPGLSGLAIRVISAPAMLVIAAVAYLFSAFTTWRLPHDQPSRDAEPDKFWSEARAGMSFTLKHHLVRSLMVSIALVNAASMFGLSAKIVYSLQVLHISMPQFIFLGSFSALGGLIAALTAAKVTRACGAGITKIAASLLCGLAVVVLPLTPQLGLSPVIWVGVSGFAWSYFVILTSLAGAGIITRLVPTELMGRVMSTFRLFTLGIMPIASIAGGAMAVWTGVTSVLWGWAVIAAASALPIIFSPIRNWKEFPEELDVHEKASQLGPEQESVTST
ncbi:MFS transporter [Pseudarthrobacter sp. J1738]|uniref:MFS transporter n=1 Tax=unclassified Pseudarthrobacter TaxID=2647000 RepID=UPI003D29F36F